MKMRKAALAAAAAAVAVAAFGGSAGAARTRPARPCGTVVLAISTVTGHEADFPVNECGLPIGKREWECGTPQQWGQPPPAPGHPWLCWKIKARKQ